MVSSLQEQISAYGVETATKDYFFTITNAGSYELIKKTSLWGRLFVYIHCITTHFHWCFGIRDRLHRKSILRKLHQLSTNTHIRHYALQTIAHIQKKTFSPSQEIVRPQAIPIHLLTVLKTPPSTYEK